MSLQMRSAIIVILVLATVAAVALMKSSSRTRARKDDTTVPASTATAGENTSRPASAPAAAKLPRLVDLGAGKCLACKQLAPILEELRKEYAGRLDVVFIDVWENPEAGKDYGIQMIPTQIFYDASGKELDRHTGFISKPDILNKFKELGVSIPPAR